MIEFKPNIVDETVQYQAVENSEAVGRITLTFHQTESAVKFIEATDDETAEGLIRSALNAAANRGAYTCTYEPTEFVSVAVLLGFETKNGKLSGEIPFLLAGHCCKTQQNGK
ncbi:MAG TPA: hypothetical protein DDY98_05390 [Ruminococcaceae bacterium]|nr:hypothetical protein [Oscillospiraceae bacterium]